MYLEDEKSTHQMADEFGCAVSTVTKYMERYGIDRDRRNYRKDVPFRDEETLRELYWGEGMAIPAVADAVGASETTVKKWMNHYDIDRRDPQKAAGIAWRVERTTYAVGTDGYVFCQSRVPEGIRQVYVHRLLAVAKYGFDAVCGKDVHHRNGVRWDNRPKNIEAMTKSEHAKHHHTERTA
jgi:transposase